MKRIRVDVQGRKAAAAIYKSQELPPCPHLEGDPTAFAIAQKPEMYGRQARIIDQVVTPSLGLLPQRGELELLTPEGRAIKPHEIHSFEALGEAWEISLLMDYLGQLSTREKAGGAFTEELTALRGLQRIMHKYGFSFEGPEENMRIAAGTMAKGLSIILPNLAQRLYDLPLDSATDLTYLNNSKRLKWRYPILDLTVGQNYKDYVNQQAGCGRFGDKISVIGDIPLQDPTIGCPLLLSPDIMQRYWRWGIDMADKCALL